MSNRMAGKVAFVTGGARGMGASHAQLLHEEGAKVVIADVLDDAGKVLEDTLGDGALYVHLDITDQGDWERAVATAVEAFGRLDVLVNNAGIVRVGDIETHSIEDWNLSLNVNVTGSFLGIKACLPELMKSGAGSIVNISSIAGIQGFGAMSAYTASKHAVVGLTKSVAIDVAPHNIRVNSVHPGMIRTPMTEGADESQKHVAMRRAGDPIEVSRLVLFLASDESAFSTGAQFVIDGGETAGLASNAVFHN